MTTFTRYECISAIDCDMAAASDLLSDLDTALDIDRDWVLAISDRDLARASDVARDLVRSLALALDRSGDLVRSVDNGLGLDLAPDLASDLDHVLLCARDLGPDLERVLTSSGAHALAPDFDMGSAARDIVRSVDSARRKAHWLLLEYGKAAAGLQGRQVVRVSGAARWLVELASRVVPAGERPRYGEEWRCELWELGLERRGRRRRQIVHAVRLLSRSWGVRGGVRAARRRPAGG